MHDAVLAAPQEVGRASETVEHTTAHDVRAVGVGVEVHFDGSVHAYTPQPPNNLRRIRDLLRAQEEFGCVAVPVLIEAVKAIGGKADGSCGCEVEVPRVEEVEETVLQHFGPDFEVFEVCAARGEAAHDCVGDVADAGLDGQEVLREPAVFYFVLQEVYEVCGYGLRSGIFGGIGLGLVWVVGFDYCDDAFGVYGDVGRADAVFGGHDQVGFASGWEVGHGDVVEAFEGGGGSVYFDDDFVRHLDYFGGCAD